MEEWKKIKDFDDYQISSLGRVKSFKFNKRKFLKNSLDKGGYYSVRLSKNKKATTKRIHQLVAIAFLNHIPNGNTLVVDHINNIKVDNRVENLQVITNRINILKSRGWNKA